MLVTFEANKIKKGNNSKRSIFTNLELHAWKMYGGPLEIKYIIYKLSWLKERFSVVYIILGTLRPELQVF